MGDYSTRSSLEVNMHAAALLVGRQRQSRTELILDCELKDPLTRALVALKVAHEPSCFTLVLEPHNSSRHAQRSVGGVPRSFRWRCSVFPTLGVVSMMHLKTALGPRVLEHGQS